jgi:hypothetical protein
MGGGFSWILNALGSYIFDAYVSRRRRCAIFRSSLFLRVYFDAICSCETVNV